MKIVSVRMTSSNNISEIKPFSITVHFLSEISMRCQECWSRKLILRSKWLKHDRVQAKNTNRLNFWYDKEYLDSDTDFLCVLYFIFLILQNYSNVFWRHIKLFHYQPKQLDMIDVQVCVVPSQWNSSCKAIY